MKDRILLYILIATLMMSSITLNVSSTNAGNNNQTCNFSDVAELPEWSIGNFWVYDMNFNFKYSNTFTIQGAIKNMKLVVVDIDEVANEYTLNITGKIDASLNIFIIPAGKYNADVTGLAHINISTLAIKDFVFLCSGTFSLFQTNVNVSMTFTPPFDFFGFPIQSDEEPWNADTYGRITGHIKVDSIYEKDFGAEGPFQNETVSFVRREDVTVPGGSYDSFLISGSTGPSHGGESNLWYSPDAGYLVKVRETIYDWQGIDATLDMPLKATNYNPGNRPPKKVNVFMHEICEIDPIDYLSDPEWYYNVKVISGNIVQSQSNYNTDDGAYEGNWISEKIWTPDKNHEMFAYSRYVTIEIQVLDYDGFWEGGEDDVADISSDVVRQTFIGIYDLLENKLMDIGGASDYLIQSGDWYETNGELPPDGSTNEDEDDAGVLFGITDNYEPPETPDRPIGPLNGKVGKEYTYSTSLFDPDGDQVYCKWDWGDGTFSDWLGPYDSGVTVDASHTWTEKGSYQIKVKAKDVYDAESEDWSDPLAVSMPKTRQSKTILNLLEQLMERFPHAFPILRELLKV
ncbi:MAG: PKD domain-containing protein [Euryarchaeota archaeon]|nr:PKD domain-containing protein [Euryarchaeota archaeon]